LRRVFEARERANGNAEPLGKRTMGLFALRFPDFALNGFRRVHFQVAGLAEMVFHIWNKCDSLFYPNEEARQDVELEETKAEIYEMLAVINRAFEQIISTLAKLQNKGALSPDYVDDHNTITNDLWAKINCQILANINTRELDDRNHYGKMRATIERRIRGRQ
jgi:hypothetical protein